MHVCMCTSTRIFPHQSRVRLPHAPPLLLVAEEVGFLVGSHRLPPPDGRLLVLSRGDAERANGGAASRGLHDG